MNPVHRIGDWLESRVCVPAYGGWVLTGFSVCFLGAAINTMAGWLYVISGVSFALLGIAATLSVRSLTGIQIQRQQIGPVSSGDRLTVELTIENRTKQPKTLLQFQDTIPFVLGKPVQKNIETILPGESYRWIYYHPTERRGVYRWHTVQVRTATPVGLFWSRRHRHVPATAIVYPTVLPLTHCPLIDEIGQEDSPEYYSRDRRSKSANENVTRSLRPYRWGDPLRLVHWRSSARYGELRVRELEIFTGGQEVIICLDSAGTWQQEDFEQAVIAAASLYFYACRSQLNTKLWTASTGLLHGNRVVLEALASVGTGEEALKNTLPDSPLIWLTQNSENLDSLPANSRWVLWPIGSSSDRKNVINRDIRGISIQPSQPLQSQLQASLV